MLNTQNNILLSNYTTFKVGGQAKNFVEVMSVDQLKEAIKKAKEENWPIFILAGGSNVIFSSKDFNGLLILIKIDGLSVEGNQIIAGASVMMSELVEKAIAAGLEGLEWAGGLPGTFGGAI